MLDVTCWEKADLLALVLDVYCGVQLSHWYPGSGVVFDFIDSWFFAYFLTLMELRNALDILF